MDPDGSPLTELSDPGVLCSLFIAVLFIIMTVLFSLSEAAGENAPGRIEELDMDEDRKERLRRLYGSIRKSDCACINAVLMCGLSLCAEYIALKLRSGFESALGAFAAALVLWVTAYGLPRRFVKDEDRDRLMISMAGVIPLLRIIAFTSGPYRALSGEDKERAATEEELLMMAEAVSQSGGIEERELDMISNVFDLHDTPVKDVMTHRTDVTYADISDDISKAAYTAINSGFSRIPVCDGSIDKICGVIYAKDLLCLVGMSDMSSMSVRSFVREAYFVPESCPCDELFEEFTKKHLQFAVVVDEYGGTSGIVTMEDIVESVFGNIRDEYDNESEDITPIGDGVFLIDGNADPEEVFETMGIPVPEDFEYDTVGAFVTKLVGHLPEDGEKPEVKYAGYTFTVILAEDKRIERIKAERLKEDDQKENEHEDG